MASNDNLHDHRKTYDKVIGMFKYGGVAVLILAFIIIWLISGK